MPFKKLEALDLQATLEHFEQSGHFFKKIGGTQLTPYVRTYKYCLNNQNISSKKSEALDLLPILEYAKIV
jgi:hypothetical protein